MPFLLPGLLGLAALASVPILIHLLNRRRYKRLPWAAMKFLRDALREEAKRIEYKDLLLMLLRALVCILLALAMARPITRLLAEDLAGKRGVVFVLDASASMSLSTGTETLLDLAKKEALSVLREMPQDATVALVDASRPASVIIPHTQDHRELEKAIEDMDVSDAGTDIAGAIRAGSALFRQMGRTSGQDVFVFSDMQASAWRADAVSIRKTVAAASPDLRLYAVPVGAGDARNLAATLIRTDPPLVLVRQPFSADVEILNGGSTPEDNLVVELRLEGKKVASSLIRALAPGESSRVRMFAEAAAPGNLVVEAVAGANKGHDRFASDDIRRSVVRVAQNVQVLLVDGRPGARFGEGETDYLDAVFAPLMDGDSWTSFAVTRVPAATLTPKDFDDKEIVFLCNVAGLRQDISTQLRTVVERGAGLVIFMGGNVSPPAYNILASPTEGSSDALLPAIIGKAFPPARPAGSKDGPEFIHLSAEKLDHEWMEFFRSKENRPLLHVPVQRALALTIPAGSTARPVASYENGVPAIVEKKLGEGRVVMVGTTATPEWNSLFNEPLGPILVSRIASAILPGSGTIRAALVGERVQLPLRAEERRMGIQLVTPDRKTATVRPEIFGDRPHLVYENRGKAGEYRYKIASTPPREEVFVLNVPADESRISPLPQGALRDLFPAGEFKLVKEPGNLAAGNALRRDRLGMEIWWPVLLCAFLLLIGEITFARLITTDAPSPEDLPRQALLNRRRGKAGAAVARGREDA